MNVTRWTAWGLVGVALLLFAYSQGRADQQASVIEHEGYALLASHTTYVRVQDSLGRLERGFVVEENFWRAKADSLANQSAITMNAAPVASSHDTLGATHLPTDSLRLLFLGRALLACDESRAVVDTALVRCAARSDSLERSLRAVLASKRPRFGWFLGPCLGATTSSAHLGLCGGWGLRF